MRIAVIGAGVSGLTLAAALKQKSPAAEVTVLERDASAQSRPQGYAIGLRNGTGLSAMAELGLREAVVRSNSIRVTNLAITNQDGRPLLSLRSSPNDPNTTFRVQRLHLKDVLLHCADEPAVRYAKRCVGFKQTDSQVVARLEDGETVEADYLVACDGAGSEIRQQSVGDHKRFLGLVAIHAESPIKVEHPLLEGGYFLTLGRSGCSFFCYRQPGGVYWSYVVHTDSDDAIVAEPHEKLLQRVTDETRGWHELVGRLVRGTDLATLGVRGYYDKEPLHRVHDGRIWMIGDAAHPMSPFQGQGANMAMLDAVGLARLLAMSPPSDADAAILDADIVKRGRDAVLESRSNAIRFHETSAFGQFQRDQAFRMANFFINAFRSRS